MMRVLAHLLVLLAASVGFAKGFISSPSSSTSISISSRQKHQSTELFFGIPSFFQPEDDDDDDDNGKKGKGKSEDPELEEKKIGLGSLFQLITAGAGAPFLGDFQGVDKETGKFMFSLEANNLVDEDGQSKQTSMPYFESGWVDPEDLEKEKRKQKGGGDSFKFPWQK
mmetsp:Transcript_56239/g.63782  ORF Transcript_56239/g.63782 Transcript_56239/m.63782 type:complete len:168 (-) Transcript_56239:154-657(-)